MCCQGQPLEQISQISPWAQQLGQQTSGMIGRGMQTGAQPMPRDLFGAYMGAAQMPSFAQGPMQFLNQMYGGGQPWQPQQFNPMDFYQSIYNQPMPTAPRALPSETYAQPG